MTNDVSQENYLIGKMSVNQLPWRVRCPALATLYEKYRPRSFDEIVGNPETIARLKFLSKTGFAGNAFWISGPSGSGKSSVASIIANSIADEFSTIQLVADSLTPAVVREMESSCMSYGMGNSRGKAVIIEEAHGLRRDSLRRLLVTLERIPQHVLWCFTTSEEPSELNDGTDLRPLLSRCIQIRMETSHDEFAKHCRQIAVKEGLVRSGVGIVRFKKLAEECHGNFRAMLQRVSTGEFL